MKYKHSPMPENRYLKLITVKVIRVTLLNLIFAGQANGWIVGTISAICILSAAVVGGVVYYYKRRKPQYSVNYRYPPANSSEDAESYMYPHLNARQHENIYTYPTSLK